MVALTKSFATSIGFTSLMSNLNLIVFDLFSMEHSTIEPFCTLRINNLGIRSDDLFERRTFESPEAGLAGAAEAFCVAAAVFDDGTAAGVEDVVDVAACTVTDSVSILCSGPAFEGNVIF